MFDFAWAEFMLVALVALIFLGPKELIALFKTLGKWTAVLRTLQQNFMRQVHEASLEMDDDKKS